MTFSSLKKSAQEYRSVFFAEEFLPRRFRSKVETVSLAIIFIIAGIFLAGYFPDRALLLSGIFLLASIAFIKQRMLDSFCSSREREAQSVADFETLSIVWKTDEKDLLRGLILSDVGEHCLLRAGASHDALERYLSSPRSHISAEKFDEAALGMSPKFSLSSYVRIVASLDPAFVALLSSEKVTLEILAGAAFWVSEISVYERKKAYWWSIHNLSREFIHIDSTGTKEKHPESSAVLPALLLRAPDIEARDGVVFTYPVLLSVASRVDKTVIGTIAPQKAFEILYTLPPIAKSSGDRVVRVSHVEELFAQK